MAQLEQVGLETLLQLGNRELVAKDAVDPNNGWALRGCESLQHVDQPGSRFGCATAFAG